MEANDIKAMREALEDARNYLLKHCGSSEAHAIARRIEAALSKPPRNCDVGTPDEWYERHDKYCNSQPTCRKCLREDAASLCVLCFARFMNRPYEQEGGAV